MEWVIGVAALAVVSIVAALLYDHFQDSALPTKILRKKRKLVQLVQQCFVVQPCFRCHEFTMKLIEVSPNGRSVHYQCLHCKKRIHAPAGTPEAAEAVPIWKEFQALVHAYTTSTTKVREDEHGHAMTEVIFDSPAAPLPYEQTTRTPIPEAVRNEVWRRDSGQCVVCGSKQSLQFDHIIPIAQGGATSVANLQILCQQCNSSKGTKV